MFCTERRVNHHGNSSKQACAQPGMVKRGLVEGRVVDNILLDTGCSNFGARIEDPGRSCCRYSMCPWRHRLYPLAKILLEVEGQPITVEAAVSNTLPMSVLLGIDNQLSY